MVLCQRFWCRVNNGFAHYRRGGWACPWHRNSFVLELVTPRNKEANRIVADVNATAQPL